MKSSSLFWLGITTLVLLAVVLMAIGGFLFRWVFFLTVAGQALLGFTVYRVLSDPYTSDKTFDDFYEDTPYE